MPVTVDVQPVDPNAERPHIIQPERFVYQSKMDSTERWRTNHRFGEMTPATLTTILNDSGEQGVLGRWADFCEFMLEQDTHLAGLHSTRVNRVVQAPSAIIPGKSLDPAKQQYAEAAAQFVRDVIDAMEKWDEYMGWWLGAMGRGFAASEAVWDRSLPLNALVITGFRFAHPHRFRYDEDWKLRLYDQGAKSGPNGYGVQLIHDNWMVHIAENDGTYPGKAGYFRSCSWPWLYKQWFKKFHAHGVETRAAPFIYGVIPNEAKSGTIDEMLKRLEQMSYDSFGAFHEGTTINSLQGADIGDGAVYTKAIELADSLQTRLVLGADDIVSPGMHGSQAAVDTRVEETLDPRTVADGKRVAGDIQDRIFAPLLRVNDHLFGYRMPPVPRLVFGGDAREDAQRVPEVRGEPDAVEPDAVVEENDVGELTPEEMAAVREMRRAVPPKAQTGATPPHSLTTSRTSPTSSVSPNPLAKVLSGG